MPNEDAQSQGGVSVNEAGLCTFENQIHTQDLQQHSQAYLQVAFVRKQAATHPRPGAPLIFNTQATNDG